MKIRRNAKRSSTGIYFAFFTSLLLLGCTSTQVDSAKSQWSGTPIKGHINLAEIGGSVKTVYYGPLRSVPSSNAAVASDGAFTGYVSKDPTIFMVYQGSDVYGAAVALPGDSEVTINAQSTAMALGFLNTLDFRTKDGVSLQKIEDNLLKQTCFADTVSFVKQHAASEPYSQYMTDLKFGITLDECLKTVK